MDPFDRFLRRPLDEVLVASGVLSRDRADELLESAKSSNETFAVVILDASVMTPWDLAKAVATHYQMPVQPLSGYRFDKDLFVGLKPTILHRHQVIPLGIFGRTRTFAVMEPPNRTLLDDLTAACGPNLFFFVSEGPEIAKVLRELVKVIDSNDTSWQKLFDSAEQEVTKDLAAPARKTR